MGRIDPRNSSAAEWRRAGLPTPTPPEPDWTPCYIRYSVPPAEGSYNYDLGGKPEGGVSVFRACRTVGEGIMVDLQESIPLAICYVRMSRFRRPYLATGRVVGYGTAREPLLEVDMFLEELPPGTEIRPNVELPPWFVKRVLYVLELERMTGAKI